MHSDCILLFPQQPSFTLPWGFLSDLANGVTDLRLGKSFLGCLKNFRFNHVHVQLTQFPKTFFWWTWFWNQPDYVEVQPTQCWECCLTNWLTSISSIATIERYLKINLFRSWMNSCKLRKRKRWLTNRRENGSPSTSPAQTFASWRKKDSLSISSP